MAPELKLIIGNKNYSSWSMRAGLALDHAGLAFEEEIIPLRNPDSKARISAYSPSGLVPALVVRSETGAEQVIWDSLAIGEWASEQSTKGPLLPEDPLERAVCRSVAAEMHSGFRVLRQALPMNMRSRLAPPLITPDLSADISRICALWEECRRDFGQGGDFLFGKWTLADALYAPVVTRFRTYGIKVSDPVQDYMTAVEADPAFGRWAAAAASEPWRIPDLD